MIAVLTLTEVVCYNCLTHFAMDEELNRRCHQDGRRFYCPNGHSQVYTESEVQKLKKINQNLTSRLGWEEDRADRLNRDNRDLRSQKSAIKGQLTKTRKRIANGVCPCCNRSFSNVARHIESKHPAFKEAVK